VGQVVRNSTQFETVIEADHRGQLLQSGPDSGTVDAFGRQRISSPFPLFESTLRYDKAPDLWNETVSGSASSTHLPNESSVALAVTASGGTVIDSGLFSSAGSVELPLGAGLSSSLGVNVDGSSEELVLTVTSSGNAKATGLLGWREIL